MAKFLFVVPPFFGHINPTLSIGAALLNKGHKVAWTGITPLDNTLIPEEGHYFFPEKELSPHQEEINQIITLQGSGAGLSGLETLKLALEDTYIPFARIMMPGVISVIDEFKPDVIINDCITFAGGLAAYLKNIPYATTTSSPPNAMGDRTIAPKVTEWASNLISDLQKSVGINEKGEFINSPELNLIFTSQEFADIDTPSPDMHFIGSVLGRNDNSYFNWEYLSQIQTPKVFVSIGTILVDIRREFFLKLIQAFENKPITIIAATDPSIIDIWPDNFIVQNHVPQLELLTKVDAVISHGGFNTISESLYNKLPILVIPIAYDQFHNASLIEKAGCGIRLRYKRMKISDLENSLHELLTNPQYQKEAERIARSFSEAGGSNKAVELLESLIQEKN